MALARCETIHGRPDERKRFYSDDPVRPLGYPETAAMCGRSACSNPALIWLEVEERKAYDAGQRVFKLPSGSVKIRVE